MQERRRNPKRVRRGSTEPSPGGDDNDGSPSLHSCVSARSWEERQITVKDTEVNRETEGNANCLPYTQSQKPSKSSPPHLSSLTPSCYYYCYCYKLQLTTIYFWFLKLSVMPFGPKRPLYLSASEKGSRGRRVGTPVIRVVS